MSLDERALEALYVRLEKKMFNVVYRWLWNKDDAQETVQEAFVRVWNQHRGDDVPHIEPLFFRTALNLSANKRRARKLWRMFSLPVDLRAASNAEAALHEARATAAVQRAVDALPEKLKQVIMLGELSGMSYEEIAATLQIPEGTVASRRHLAMKALEKALGAFNETR